MSLLRYVERKRCRLNSRTLARSPSSAPATRMESLERRPCCGLSAWCRTTSMSFETERQNQREASNTQPYDAPFHKSAFELSSPPARLQTS
jgi:hypothetical protein